MIYTGDCIEIMRTLPANSYDSIVTDPPYELRFMGRRWDASGVAFRVETWAEALRVAKPGAWLAAFGATRKHHRLMCAIEDAGWELRDTVMWVYGSGFPKSHNGDWGGTALKPAWEPIVLARKPLEGTVEANWRKWGTGALNIDGCRVGTEGARNNGRAAGTNGIYGHIGATERVDYGKGRWPANLIHDGGDEVLSAFPPAPGQMVDASSNTEARKTQNVYGEMRRGRGNEPSAASANDGAVGFKMRPGMRRLDAGSAARFFYCAKASRADRNDGCENNHPTVKPSPLMQWLCRLVTPCGGRVLDPFVGSGSTGRGARAEGMEFDGIELDPANVEIANARIEAQKRRSAA